MSSCIVQFDNFQGQYYPGSNVVGRVVCSFSESKNIREIRLKLRGKEHNNWMGTESYYDSERKETRTRTVEYYGDNRFLAVDTTLRGSGDVGPGRFEYSFNFVLPKNIPGTYNGKYGWIRYSIKATVDRPFKTDYEDVKEFIVVAPIDFNEMKDQLVLNPVSYSDDKTLCCCCCASDPITMNVHLDKEAYIQGETARVKVEITNMANKNVESVEVKMGMTVESRVTYPSSESKYDYELLAAHNDTGVGAHGERTYDILLPIPKSTVVPNFNLCTLFKQWTKLKVTAVLPSCHGNVDISTMIVMGHIPVGGQVQFQNVPLQQSAFYPPQQNNQFPASGGVPYPSDTIPPYPASDPHKPSYPSGNNSPFPGVHQPPYPPSIQPPPYANPVPYPPIAVPPGSSSMGFAVPQRTASEFPSLPSGALPPMPQPNSAPYPPALGPSGVSGPSAPPMEDKSSAPPKAEMAEGGDFVMLDASGIAPPSYNEAVPFPPYPPK